MSRNIVIIFAGGSGVRMGAGIPKQFIEIDGKPILIHTLEIFENHSEIDEIYVACKEDYIEKLQRMFRRYDITKVRKVVPGGNTALDSQYRGLKAAQEDGREDDDIVMIHDGVRPCITRGLISRVIQSVKDHGSGIPTTPLVETPVITDDGQIIKDIPNRKYCFTAQAPQGFRLGDIIEAHEIVRKDNPDYVGIVDSATMLHNMGRTTAMVKGSKGNIKVTTPEDLYIFRGMRLYKESQDAFGLNLAED